MSRHQCRVVCLAYDMRGRVVEELRSRFAHYMKTGDDSKIPAELEIITYGIVSPTRASRLAS